MDSFDFEKKIEEMVNAISNDGSPERVPFDEDKFTKNFTALPVEKRIIYGLCSIIDIAIDTPERFYTSIKGSTKKEPSWLETRLLFSSIGLLIAKMTLLIATIEPSEYTKDILDASMKIADMIEQVDKDDPPEVVSAQAAEELALEMDVFEAAARLTDHYKAEALKLID